MVNDNLAAFTGVLRSVLLTTKSLKLLRKTHGRIALIVVLHLRVRVLRNLHVKNMTGTLRGSRLERSQGQGTSHE